MHLVNEAVNNKVDVFVFTSSIAVYGTNQALPSLVGPAASEPVLAIQCASQRNAAFLFGSFVCCVVCVCDLCATSAYRLKRVKLVRRTRQGNRL